MRKQNLSALAAIPMMLVAAPVTADPQMLGVIQTASMVPLHCSRTVCTAELTAICLHERRPTPVAGHPYKPYNPDAVNVTGTRPDGTRMRLEAKDVLGFAAARGFTSAKVSVPARILAETGLASISVKVTRPLTLVPVSQQAGDPANRTESEIELAAGPMRATADRVVDQDTDTMHASQLLARMIDALPRAGRAEPDLRAALWQSPAVPYRDKLSETGDHRARTAFNRCYRQTRIGDKNLRGCLAEAHDDFVRGLNVKYWDALKAGS